MIQYSCQLTLCTASNTGGCKRYAKRRKQAKGYQGSGFTPARLLGLLRAFKPCGYVDSFVDKIVDNFMGMVIA